MKFSVFSNSLNKTSLCATFERRFGAVREPLEKNDGPGEGQQQTNGKW